MWGCQGSPTEPSSQLASDSTTWYPARSGWAIGFNELSNSTLNATDDGFNVILTGQTFYTTYGGYIVIHYANDNIVFHNATATKAKISYTISFSPVDPSGNSYYESFIPYFGQNYNDAIIDSNKFTARDTVIDIPQGCLYRNVTADTTLDSYSKNPQDIFMKDLVFYFAPYTNKRGTSYYSGTITVSNVKIIVY